MKKKAVVLCLSLAMAVATLSACGGKDGGTNQQSEKAAETAKAEASKTEDAEADRAGKIDEGIIPLYRAEFESEIRGIAPADLLYFDNFSKYFPVSSAGTDDNGREIYRYENIESFDLKFAGDNFEEVVKTRSNPDKIDPETTTTVKIGFLYDQFGELSVDIAAGEKNDRKYDLVPLFFDKNKGCLVCYYFTKDEDGQEKPSLNEIYYDDYMQCLGNMNPVKDPGEYGFTAMPSADTRTSDELIPLFKAELWDEIMDVPPADLYSFEKFSYYFPVREVITDENGFFIYGIENDAAMEMRDYDYFKNLEDGTRYDVNYYFYGKAEGSIISNYWLVDGYSDQELDSQMVSAKDIFSMKYDSYAEAGRQDFLPLLFDKTKGCFVGYRPDYSENNGSGYSVIEYYYNSYDFPNDTGIPVKDPALYGFK